MEYYRRQALFPVGFMELLLRWFLNFFDGLIFMLFERPREVEICQNMHWSNQRAQDKLSQITLEITLKKADLQLQEAFADVEIAKAIDTIVEGNALRRRRDAPEKERDGTDVQ